MEELQKISWNIEYGIFKICINCDTGTSKKKKKKEKRNIEDNIFRCLGEKIWQSFGKELFTLV